MGVAGIRRLDRPKMGGVWLACTLLACAKGLTPNRMPAAPKTAQKVATVEALGEAVAVAAPDAFDWFDHWYPVNVVDSMDPSRPHKVQLLGLNLVLWNDGATVRGEKAAGSWRAFEDSCPHRRGPLSEGRVEDDGTLLCSYHGWRYDGSGACSDLPYSPESKRARHQCSASCASFPTQVADGMVWVFPNRAISAIEALLKPAPLVSELHDPRPGEDRDWQVKIPAGVRDFPCGWDTMVENTLDPAHFCAAHHGTLGDRYSDPRAYTFKTTKKVSRDGGFELDGDMGSLEFVPPCLVKYRPNYGAMPFEGALVLATYCVPTAPGKVRPLATVLRDRAAPFGETLSERALAVFMGPTWFPGLVPKWFGHIASSVVLHQDAALLYEQYRNLIDEGYEPTKPGSKSFNQVCYMPNDVDRGVTAYRRWLQVHAGGGVPWACDDALPPRGSEDIFDMWDAHTSHCSHCLDAYRNFGIARDVAAGAVVVAALLPDAAPRLPVGLAAAALALGIDRFMGLFRRYEFSHHDND